MPHGRDNRYRIDSVVLLLMFGLFLFFSPFVAWWSSHTRLWYLPYLIWLGLIGLIAWASQRDHEL